MGRYSTIGARALAVASEPYAYTLYRRLALPCAAPSSHLSYKPCRRRHLYSPRLCGSYLSRSAAPRRWNRQLLMCLPMRTRGSLSRGPRQHELFRLRSDGRMFRFRRVPTFVDFVVVASYYEYRTYLITFQNF